MPLTNSIVHPRMLAAIPHAFNSLCSIGRNTETSDESGQEIHTYPIDPSLIGIPCYVEPQMQREIRRADSTVVNDAWTIALRGYYPTINVEDRAVIDGTQNHNILSVKHDDTHTITFLDTEIVT